MNPEKKSRLKKTLTTAAPIVLAAVAGALAASVAAELTKKNNPPEPRCQLTEHQYDLLSVENMIRANGDQYVVSDGDKIWYADSLAWLIEHNPGMK